MSPTCTGRSKSRSGHRIGIRSSTVRSFEGAELVIPNSKLVSETFVNWTLSDRQRRIEIPVGVSSGNDPDRVLEVLKAVVAARPEVLQLPASSALFHGFGHGSLDWSCLPCIPDRARIRSSAARAARRGKGGIA
jgi:small-conductance mechanosensitive channel